MVKLNLVLKAALPLLCLLPAACAGYPVATGFSLSPGIAADASTYSIAPPEDEVGRAALPYVDQQLRRLGFQPSPTPQLTVRIAVTERGRDVGAFSPDACQSSQWAQAPGKKWLAGGGRIAGLQIVMLDARTGLPVYRSAASMRTSSGAATSHVAALAAAALRDDPRNAKSCAAG